MQIEILSLAEGEHALDAWTLSRGRGVTYNKAEVYAVDAPVMEMPSALLHFEDFTILEREIFTSLRNHVIWARTSRVDDGRQFRVPKEFERLEHEEIRAKMVQAALAGQQQDQWRMDLPLVSLTSWTARMDVRTMAKLRDYFRHHLFHLVGMRLGIRFNAVAAALDQVLVRMGFHMPVGKGITQYLNEAPIGEGAPGKFYLANSDTFIVAIGACSIALRAQLVRHREIHFADDYLKRVISSPFYEDLTLSSTVSMELHATKQSWSRIMSKRTCWIAQADLWQPLTDAFGPGLLPCADGHCPYAVDAEQRLTDKDPGCPCPRYLNLTDRPALKAQYRERIEKEAATRPAFWQQEI